MQIEKYKPAMSHRMHQQGFSTGSVREIMQELDTELQRVAEDAGVSVIISRWEVAFSNPAVELIDVTPQVVALIDSSEEALAMIRDIQESEPVPWEQLLAHEEDRRPIVDEIRPVIDEQGVEAGIGRYLELRDAACEHHRAQLEAAAEEYDFSEAQLNELGYYYLSAGETEIAIEIFKLNVEAYPKAFNTYDSLGEGYMEAGQTDLAVENYMRSLELNPENDNARQMLERMGVEHEDAG
jgi:tetratricopeptide (TPR) repeat protein